LSFLSLNMNALCSSETSVNTIPAKERRVPGDKICHCLFCLSPFLPLEQSALPLVSRNSRCKYRCRKRHLLTASLRDVCQPCKTSVSSERLVCPHIVRNYTINCLSQPYIQWMMKCFFPGWIGWGARAAILFSLVPRLRMCGAINVLPHTHSWLHINVLKISVAAGTVLHGTVRGLWSNLYSYTKRNTLIRQFFKCDGLNFGGSYIYILRERERGERERGREREGERER
jgi:hypothetical protein